MVVLLFSVELEVLKEVNAPERDKFMAEVSEAYQARSECLKAMGRSEAAQIDIKRAAKLEQEARKLAEKIKSEMGQIELINRWRDPVSVVIDGVEYRLAVGETKKIPREPGPFRYQLPSTGQNSTGQVEAGKTFGIQIR
jgi:hypothetical protein